MMPVDLQPNQRQFTFRDVESVLPLKTWWALFFVLPFVKRLTLVTVNYTQLKPNTITILSIFLKLLAAWFYLKTEHISLMAGAILYYGSYVFDCMDGAVARLKKESSNFGRYLDHLGDLLGGMVALAALAYGQGLLYTPLVAGLLLCHLSECYISYLVSNIVELRNRSSLEIPEPKIGGFLSLFVRYRQKFHDKNIKSFFSFPDYECLVFLIFPLLGWPAMGIGVGFVFALIIVLYTILSTFTLLHSGGKVFP